MRRLAENKSEDLTLHSVYTGNYFWGDSDTLLSFILVGMKKHNIKEVMMTLLRMEKINLITKENMELLRGKKIEERIGQ